MLCEKWSQSAKRKGSSPTNNRQRRFAVERHRQDVSVRTSMVPFAGQSSSGLHPGSDSRLASCGTRQYPRTRSADTIWFSTFAVREGNARSDFKV